jgi:hypothetical protein
MSSISPSFSRTSLVVDEINFCVGVFSTEFVGFFSTELVGTFSTEYDETGSSVGNVDKSVFSKRKPEKENFQIFQHQDEMGQFHSKLVYL